MQMEDYGRMHTRQNIPIVRNKEAMSALVRDWAARMQHADHLFQAKGWVKTYKVRDGAHVYLPHAARQRGNLVRELCDEAGWDVQMETLLCGLTVRELDKFFANFRPCGAKGGRYLQEKAEQYACKCMGTDTREGLTGWFDDAEAEPFPEEAWDMDGLLGRRSGGGASRGATGGGGGHRAGRGDGEGHEEALGAEVGRQHGEVG